MFIESNGVDIHVQQAGPAAADAVLLLHSIGTQGAIWEESAAMLAQRYRTIRVDLRGHGLSATTRGPYSLEQLACDALGILDALAIHRAHVAGISLGGMVAQALAALAPDRVLSLILIDTALSIPPSESWHERAALVRSRGTKAIVDTVLPRWVTAASIDGAVARGLRRMLLHTDAEGYAGAAEAIAGASIAVTTPKLRLPALVLVGEADVATPLASAQALRDAIPGSALDVIRRAAHIPTVEQPGVVSRAIEGFLDSIRAANSSRAGIGNDQ